MLRHGAPSPTLSNPLETRGLGHGVPSFKGFRLPSRILLHPFAGFGWADTTGGGGAASSCTEADTAGCWYRCRRWGFGTRIVFTATGLAADSAERASAQRCLGGGGCMLFAIGADTAEARSCLGGGGCRLLPPSSWADTAGCGFGIGTSSSLSKK